MLIFNSIKNAVIADWISSININLKFNHQYQPYIKLIIIPFPGTLPARLALEMSINNLYEYNYSTANTNNLLKEQFTKAISDSASQCRSGFALRISLTLIKSQHVRIDKIIL